MKKTKVKKLGVLIGSFLLISFLITFSIHNYKVKLNMENDIDINAIDSLDELEEILEIYLSHNGEFSLYKKNMIKEYIDIFAGNVDLAIKYINFKELDNVDLGSSLENIINLNDKSELEKAIKAIKEVKLCLREMGDSREEILKNKNKEEWDVIVKNIKYINSFNN